MQADRRIVPFRRQHYDWLAGGGSREGAGFLLTPDIMRQIESSNSWTGVVDGEPVACGGTILHWPGRHMAWAFIGAGTLRHMPWITAEAKRILDGVAGRIEFTVRADFPAGQRWARHLGFEVETPVLRSYGPAHEDHVGYARFN